jgi:hypothetical protein
VILASILKAFSCPHCGQRMPSKQLMLVMVFPLFVGQWVHLLMNPWPSPRAGSVEQCQPEAAEFWSVYGHGIDGGIHSFEDDFPTQAEADAFAATLRRTYPHLAEGGAP